MDVKIVGTVPLLVYHEDGKTPEQGDVSDRCDFFGLVVCA